MMKNCLDETSERWREKGFTQYCKEEKISSGERT